MSQPFVVYGGGSSSGSLTATGPYSTSPIVLASGGCAANVNGTTVTLNTTGATLLVAYLFGISADATISDNQSNTWNYTTSYDNGNYSRIAYAYSKGGGALATASSHVFTVAGGGGTYECMAVYAVANTLTTSAVFGGVNGVTFASQTGNWQPGSVSTQAGDLVIMGWGGGTQTVTTISDGFQPVYVTTSLQIGSAYRVGATGAALNPTATSNVSAQSMSAVIATFHGAGQQQPLTFSGDSTGISTGKTLPSYTFWVSGGITYAKNGSTGNVDFANTDAAIVINSCLQTLATTGGRLYFKNGTYNLNSVTLEDYGAYAGTNSYWCIGIPSCQQAFTFQGESQSGVIFNVTTAAETMAGTGHTISAFFQRPFSSWDAFLSQWIYWSSQNFFYDLSVNFPVNTRGNEIGINMLEASYAVFRNVGVAFVYGNGTPSVASAAGNVGISSPATYSDGCVFENVVCTGFYYGFDINTEHSALIADVVAYLCTYGFTYGRVQSLAGQNIGHAGCWHHIEVYDCINGIRIGPHIANNSMLNILGFDLEYIGSGPWAFSTAVTETTGGLTGGVINFAATTTTNGKVDLLNLFTNGLPEGKNYAVTQLGYAHSFTPNLTVAQAGSLMFGTPGNNIVGLSFDGGSSLALGNGTNDDASGILKAASVALSDITSKNNLSVVNSTASQSSSGPVPGAGAINANSVAAATVPINVNIGDYVVVGAVHAGAAQPTITDDGGNTYTFITTNTNWAYLHLYVCAGATSVATKITQSGGGTAYSMSAATFVNVSGVGANANAGNYQGASPGTVSVTTTANNSLVVGVFDGNFAYGFHATSGSVLVTGFAGVPAAILAKAQPTSGTATSLTAAWTTNVGYAICAVELKGVGSAAISNSHSPSISLQGTAWNGSASIADAWTIQDILGSGSNPTSTLNISHSGSSGSAAVQVPVLTAATLIETTTHTPSSAADTGTTGQIAWDANYIYICTNTNTWKRVAIASW